MQFDATRTPEGPGIYALVHRGTKSIYVAHSKNIRARAYVWRNELKGRTRDGWPAAPPEEWELKTLQASVSKEDAEPLIRRASEQAVARGFTLLRVLKPLRDPMTRKEVATSLMKARVLDDDGTVLTYKDLSPRLSHGSDKLIAVHRLRNALTRYLRAHPGTTSLHWRKLAPYIPMKQGKGWSRIDHTHYTPYVPHHEDPTDDSAYADPTLA